MVWRLACVARQEAKEPGDLQLTKRGVASAPIRCGVAQIECALRTFMKRVAYKVWHGLCVMHRHERSCRFHSQRH